MKGNLNARSRINPPPTPTPICGGWRSASSQEAGELQSQQEYRQMIDDRTVYRLLDHIVGEVLREMDDGKTLTEIDEYDLAVLRKKDRMVLYEYMAEQFQSKWFPKIADAVAAHLRTLKRRKPPRRTQSPATVIPFRPEDRPT
jgi:hypothetical protein